jgi:twinkle protein|tara:strand:- start:53 stop:1681 length:1629 start_codon:yes stop_codon:yes gene_type:complete
MGEQSQCVTHAPCPRCKSIDNLAVYDDGHSWCFTPGCGYRQHGEQPKENNLIEEKYQMEFIKGESEPLKKRGLTKATVEKWGYQVGEFKGKKVQIANYKKDGHVVAQKLRFPNKDFLFIGETKEAGLYGKHLWEKGKMITICEGELDALSVSQAQGNKWPVVSIPTGAAGARKALQNDLEYLENFETVVLMFDQDDAGQKAVDDCVQLFSPGKCKIASLPLNDPNEMIQASRGSEIISAIWNAKSYRPDGIIDAKDLWDLVSINQEVDSMPYPFNGLNNMTQGIRKGEIVTITAGSGVGKSQVCREIAYSLMLRDQKVGYLALEENTKRTALGFIGLYLNKPIHLQSVEHTAEELKDGFDNVLGTGNLFLYDHWGSMEINHLFNKIRYLVKGVGCSYIVLDHLTIILSGLEGGDERRMLDFVMTKLRSLVEELQCSLILVSHLRRPSGDKGHEEGVRTSLNQLRGSHGIAQLSDIVIGCERNQQDEENPDLTTVRVLKNRWSGDTGIADTLHYSKETGRMVVAASPDEAKSYGFEKENKEDF